MATKLQPDVRCVTVYLTADFGVDKLEIVFLANFLQIFATFCTRITRSVSFRFVTPGGLRGLSGGAQMKRRCRIF
jgi:hypothetical protein